jgi:hypothetical protein
MSRTLCRTASEAVRKAHYSPGLTFPTHQSNRINHIMNTTTTTSSVNALAGTGGGGAGGGGGDPVQQQQQQQQQPAPSAMAASGATASGALGGGGGAGGAPPTDVDSIMRKMADQQTMIASLNEQLVTKSEDVQKLSEKQRKEMKHIYDTVIAGWVDQQDTVNAQTRDEFKNGIMRLADTAQEDNGIWQVVMCASSASQRDRACAAQKETEFQTLNKNYEELKTRVEGGRFTREEARVGDKRSAPEEVMAAASAPASSGIWDQFGDFMKSGYSNDSFAPPVTRSAN